MPYKSILTPIGEMTLFEQDGALVAVEWGRAEGGGDSPLLIRAEEQLDAYFEGTLRAFDLPLKPASGSDFQRRVWAAMARIPYGQWRSYGDLARELDSGPRSIGMACGRNPLPILVPCHRVLAAQGRLGGYSGGEGPSTKRWLLDLEQRGE